MDSKTTESIDESIGNDVAIAEAEEVTQKPIIEVEGVSTEAGPSISHISQDFVILPVPERSNMVPSEVLPRAFIYEADAPKPMSRVESDPSLDGSDADLVSEGGEEKMSAMKAVILFVALSFDSVFAGLELGLQSDEIGTWNMVIAILSHEVVFSFMLVLELLKHYIPLHHLYRHPVTRAGR